MVRVIALGRSLRGRWGAKHTRLMRNVLFPLGFGIGLLVFWEFAVRILDVSPFILPAPSNFLLLLWDRFDAIAHNAVITAHSTVIGFAIGTAAGVVFGGVVGTTQIAYRSVYPTLIGFNSIPKISLVPVFVVWLGAGQNVAILTAATMAFFPVLVVVATSVATTEPELEDVLRTLGATRREMLQKVSIPRAMPQFFGSVKIAIVQAFIGTIIAEMVATNSGLGYLMIVGSGNLDVPLVFAGLMLLSLMGVAFYLVANAFERRMVSWAYRGSR